MLFKNGERITLSQRDIEDLAKKLNFPIRITYTESMIRPNRKNRKPDRPAGVSIPYRETIKTDKGTEEWRYAENMVIDPKGRPKYTPHVMEFTGDKILTRKDIELVYFLYHKSRLCGNGSLEEEQRKRPRFEILDEKRKADEKVAGMQDVTKFEVALLNSEAGLSDERLKELAYAYFVPNVDQLSVNQIRLHLRQRVLADKKDGISKFLKMADANTLLETKGRIQKAVDRKIVNYSSRTRKWMWKLADGSQQDICQVTGGMHEKEALYNYLVANKDLMERLVAELKSEQIVETE